MAKSRPRKVAGLVVVSAIVVAGLAIARLRASGDSAMPSYGGHLLLVWAIDKKTGVIAGFSRGTIRPGQAAELIPATGHSIRIEAGRIEAVEVTDFRKEWKEDLIQLKISHGRFSSEGSKALTVPFLSLDFGINEPVSTVILGIPVTPLGSPPYQEVLRREDPGTASGLEDLLFAAYENPQSGGYVAVSDVLDVYRMLVRSQRLNRWRSRLSGGTPENRLEAAAVLMVLGDEPGTATFCQSCLQAQGDDQVRLIDILCQMPPSETALVTIVKLIVAPRTYLQQSSRGSTAQTERRHHLLRALSEKYPKEIVRKHGEELRAYGESLPAGSGQRETLRALLESR